MLNYSLVIFFLVICTSCSNKEYSYFPLSSGLKWHYNVLLTTRDGLKKQKYILHNIGSDKLNGESVFLRKSLGFSPPPPVNIFLNCSPPYIYIYIYIYIQLPINLPSGLYVIRAFLVKASSLFSLFR